MESRRQPKAPRTDALPPPTPSEAAFERALAELRARRSAEAEATCAPVPESDAAGEMRAVAVEEGAAESAERLVARLFENKDRYLRREPYAGIGEARSFYTKIVGVSFEGRQDILAGLRGDEELRLERQPDNPHDSNAIAVFRGALQIGFLRKEIAKELAPRMDRGVRYRARATAVTGGPSHSDPRRSRGLNIFVERIDDDRGPSRAAPVERPAEEIGEEEIRRALIGDYRPHDAQQAVLERLAEGANTLAVFGTGRGKSFCFQFEAALRAVRAERKTLVLYPLRALANDQHYGMRRRLEPLGLRIHRANGAIEPAEREELFAALRSGAWDVILATPEFVAHHREAFTGISSPSLLVLDETHHVHESRHRAVYAEIAQLIAALGSPQILALTATLRDEAFETVRSQLKIERWVIDPTVRENLRIADARRTADKDAYLRVLFGSGERGIVYVNSRNDAVEIAARLGRAVPFLVAYYHAGLPSDDRRKVEEAFREGAIGAVVATSAFGEGIDLPDVRHVVLYHLNFDVAEFNQQAGRAGRDGDPATIHLLYGERDRSLNEFLIEQEFPSAPTLRAIYRGLRAMASGGVIRADAKEIAAQLDLRGVRERAIETAVKIFADEGLVEVGRDDDGPFLRLVPVEGKVDIERNERVQEGEAARESFARFCDLALGGDAETLQRVVDRPLYPIGIPLLR